MKFTTALVLSGAAIASAAAVAPRDACPVVKKTIKVSWIEEKVIKKMQTWTKEEAKKCVDDSKYDPKQVYPSLNATKTAYPTSKPTKAPYPTGTWYGNGTNTYTAHPTGGVSSTKTASATPSSTPSQPPNADGVCRNPSQRTEWSNLSENERQSFISSIKCLMEKDSASSRTFPGSHSRYEDLVSVHQQLAGEVHDYGVFLVFHRYLLNVFAEVIRDECGYNGRFPWWDETKDAGNFRNAHIFRSGYFGSIHESVTDSAGNKQGVCVTDAGWGDRNTYIGPGYAVDNEHCISRGLDEGWSSNANGDAVANCRGSQNYDAYRFCNERTIHAAGHFGIGALMIDAVASTVDPSFWMHHGYIDQAYYSWQQGAEHRTYEVGGPKYGGGDINPDDMLHSYGIRPAVKIADVLDTTGGYLCYTYDKN